MKAQTFDCPLNVNGWTQKKATSKTLRINITKIKQLRKLTFMYHIQKDDKKRDSKFRIRSRIAQGAFQCLGKVRLDRNIF